MQINEALIYLFLTITLIQSFVFMYFLKIRKKLIDAAELKIENLVIDIKILNAKFDNLNSIAHIHKLEICRLNTHLYDDLSHGS